MLHINAVLRVRQCFAKKNCASHDCSASHHCRLVSSFFEIRHAKTSLVQTCHKNEIRLHIPLLNWPRQETCKTKLKTVPPATQISLGKSCNMQVKKNVCLVLVVPCDMQQKHKHAQGSFLPARTAAKIDFAISLLYAPVEVQLTSCIPACFSHSHQPNRFVSKLQKAAEALEKISTFPTDNPLGACIPVWHKNTSASNCKPHCFKTRFALSRFQMLLFRGNSNEREFPSIKYLETLHMIPFHDLSASDSICAEKFMRGDPELHGVEACTCTQR